MQQRPRQRLIVDSDAKNEADDQFAIVHALLSPSLNVEGIIAAHFGTAGSMQSSKAEIDLLVDLLEPMPAALVVEGAPAALPDTRTPMPSAGSQLIIDRALERGDDGPLHIAFLGPLTDMASALLQCPAIARENVVVIWVGGPPHDDINGFATDPEFNLRNDIAAANVVFDSGAQVWQIPSDVYQMVGVGYAELEQRCAPQGRLGRYLVDQLKRWNAENVPWDVEYRSLGDSPAIGAVLNPLGARWRMRPAPRFDAQGQMLESLPGRHHIRVCESVDVRYLLEDLFAKLHRFATPGSRH